MRVTFDRGVDCGRMRVPKSIMILWHLIHSVLDDF